MSSVLYGYIITGLPSCRQLEPRQPEAFRLLRVSLRWIDNQGRKVGGSMPELPRVNPKPKPKPNPGLLHGLVQLALYQISAGYRLVANRVGDWHVDIGEQEGENQHQKTAFDSTFRWKWKLKSVCPLHRGSERQ